MGRQQAASRGTRAAKRGDYFPDIVSPAARRLKQALEDWRFCLGMPSQPHQDLAEEVLRWRAGELIAAGVRP